MFITELRKTNKILFLLVLLYPVYTIAFAFTKFQVAPFYVWNMFSLPQNSNEEYRFYDVYINDQRVSTANPLNYFNTMVFEHGFSYYYSIKEETNYTQKYAQLKKLTNSIGLNGDAYFNRLFVREDQIKKYPAWLKSYYASKLNIAVNKLRVEELTVKYSDHCKPTLVAKKLIFNE